MKLVLKRWFIKQHFGDEELSTEEILKKYSVTYKSNEKSLGVLYATTDKAIKYIRKDHYSGREVFDFLPKKALVLVDDERELSFQVKAYDIKNLRYERTFALSEVESFLSRANIWEYKNWKEGKNVTKNV